MELVAEKLTPEAFAPYGEVVAAAPEFARQYFEEALGNARAHARPSLSLIRRAPQEPLPLEVKLLERHAFSSQTFIPIDVARWLIVVCPHAASGGPDVARAKAFLASPDEGVTYRMNTWHHELTVLDRPARFAIFMWRDGSPDDEEFVPVAPFTVRLGA